jgi:DNA-directed RNA polymerase specialized sigma24 family protein
MAIDYHAAALRLKVMEGLSAREAAKRLGIGPMTVCRRQKRGLEALRGQLQGR